MSLRQVRKPHMKNNVVTTANGPVEDDDDSGETAAERLGVAIDIVRVSARHHSRRWAQVFPFAKKLIDLFYLDDQSI